MDDDNDGQMIFLDLVGLKLPDIRLAGEEKQKKKKNLTQETCSDRGSNSGPLRERRACYHLVHEVMYTYTVCTKSVKERYVTRLSGWQMSTM